MRGIEHELPAIVAARVARDLVRAVEYAHGDVGGDQRQLPSHRLWWNRILVEIEADVDGFGRTHRLDAVGGKRIGSVRQQTRSFLGERVGNAAMIAAGPRPGMRHLIAPQPSLAVAFGKGGERSPCPEGFAHVTNGAFDASLLIPGPDLARTRREVIMRAQLDQARMEGDVIATTLQYGAFEVVVKNDARLPVEKCERMHVAP